MKLKKKTENSRVMMITGDIVQIIEMIIDIIVFVISTSLFEKEIPFSFMEFLPKLLFFSTLLLGVVYVLWNTVDDDEEPAKTY